LPARPVKTFASKARREREATVDALATALDVPKTGLFTVLATLDAAGHVEREEVRTVRFAN